MNKRYEILLEIQRHHVQRGYSPTLEEIAAMVGLRNRAGTHYHVQALIDEGLLLAEPKKPRSMRLTDQGRQFLADLILLGEGQPNYRCIDAAALQEIEGDDPEEVLGLEPAEDWF